MEVEREIEVHCETYQDRLVFMKGADLVQNRKVAAG